MTDNMRFSLIMTPVFAAPPRVTHKTRQHQAVERLGTGQTSARVYPYPFRTFHRSWHAAPAGRLYTHAMLQWDH